ncbi:hypothetical protein W97_08074 [Coniosporium apollinis CBS 100218]|uniref:D-3-phosphoglycerate dehydrogenase n=1 Tax=Coniosporium apollinis (strain CBS 100218) TaxID=1168221 RepID=R7Z4F6_CONA1|nr:uncharacterized protein W97_08074 [Coniosporium apollinis CBS 100218]EON68816.1 hypothetical protein W97_08074 [Coniosporium apollinis CBS 100218]
MAPARILDSPPAKLSSAVEKPTVYMLDTFHPAAVAFCQARFNTILPDTPEHAQWRQKAKYLLIRSSYLTAEDIEQCPNLLAISKQGVGIDKIDAATCAARGIKIFNTPGVNAQAVAELVLTLTTAVAREVCSISVRQASGKRVPKETCSGLILHNKTIGILGMGNIGKTVAKMFRGAFDAPVVAYDPFLPLDAWPELPHTRASTVEEVLKVCDILTIHVPLTPETKHLISYSELQMMKRTAILINTARGGIVNESDLEQGLRDELIWGAGLDCHEQEPPSKEKYELLWNERVVSTPHIGATTAQTQQETATAAVARLYDFVSGRNPGK